MDNSEMYETIMKKALVEASRYIGATSPNPPVGAAVMDNAGRCVSVQAHCKAGGEHAEILALKEVQNKKINPHTLITTLEPCAHDGKTPPCTEAIINAGVQNVVIGIRDPNPAVNGRGIQQLREAGIRVVENVCKGQCALLIRPFRQWVTTGRPWITIKTAVTEEGSMIPPPGKKTFTSEQSLKLVHQLRKHTDAIVTGSGTILADDPLFTVRHVKDHPEKQRWLIVLDRRNRIPQEWVTQAHERGFSVKTNLTLKAVFDFLGTRGVLNVLVEAGPTLSMELLKRGLWNEHIAIIKGDPDLVLVRYNERAV